MRKEILLAVTILVMFSVTFAAYSAQAKEPYATAEEWGKYVVSRDSIPWTQLSPGANTRMACGDRILVSFITMSPWSVFPKHAHEAEEIVFVVDGYMDEGIDGKLYRLNKGDVIKLPSNIPHAIYIYDVPCVSIDIFSPVRPDYIQKAKEQETFGVVISK